MQSLEAFARCFVKAKPKIIRLSKRQRVSTPKLNVRGFDQHQNFGCSDVFLLWNWLSKCCTEKVRRKVLVFIQYPRIFEHPSLAASRKQLIVSWWFLRSRYSMANPLKAVPVSSNMTVWVIVHVCARPAEHGARKVTAAWSFKQPATVFAAMIIKMTNTFSVPTCQQWPRESVF